MTLIQTWYQTQWYSILKHINLFFGWFLTLAQPFLSSHDMVMFKADLGRANRMICESKLEIFGSVVLLEL